MVGHVRYEMMMMPANTEVCAEIIRVIVTARRRDVNVGTREVALAVHNSVNTLCTSGGEIRNFWG